MCSTAPNQNGYHYPFAAEMAASSDALAVREGLADPVPPSAGAVSAVSSRLDGMFEHDDDAELGVTPLPPQSGDEGRGNKRARGEDVGGTEGQCLLSSDELELILQRVLADKKERLPPTLMTKVRNAHKEVAEKLNDLMRTNKRIERTADHIEI